MIQSVIDQMVYFAYFQSILLTFIYGVSSKNRKRINPFLAIFVAVLVIGLTGRVIYLSGIFGHDTRWIVFSELATLFFGTTIYLFTRSSLLGKKFERSDLYHYVLPLVYNCIVVFTFIVFDETRKSLWLVLTIIGIGLFVNIAYYMLSVRLFFDFRSKLQDELSYTVKSQFFFNFLACIGLCLASWLVLFVFGIIDIKYLPRTSWQLIWFSIAIIILLIAYYGIQDPELYKINLPKEETQKYVHSKFSEVDLDQLKKELEHIMNIKKPYLNQKLLKSELAEMMGVSNPEMARLLNERIGMNFFEYINYYRIKEFIELAKTEKAKRMSLFGLAQESGFYSKTTFNKSFKQLMGMTPTAYFNRQSK